MNVLKKISLALMVLGAFGANAQDAPKNNVKLNLLPLVGSTISVEYERALNKDFSLNGTVALMPKGSLPFSSSISSLADDSAILDATKLGAFSLALEGRYYTSRTKEAMRGFYLAPYVKYSTYNINSRVDFDVPSTNTKSDIPISGNLNAFSGGVAVGLQWIFSNRISLDWRIIGVSYGGSSGSLKGHKALTTEEQEEVRNQLNNLSSDLPVIKLKNEVNGEGVKSTISGPWAGLRTGLAIGYSF